MFGIPGEVFWPTAAFASIIVLVAVVVTIQRYLPRPRAREINRPDREALEDLQDRLGQLEQLQQRVSELEERVDFAERLLAKQRDGERLGLPPK
jgi:hypothetical protein